MTHLPPKNYRDDYEQRREAEKLAEAIARAEDSAAIQHRRSLICGDFNMNPWDAGMIAANGLHAVMTRSIAEGSDKTTGGRQVGGRPFRFFYNPMWAQFGEQDGKPVGSHYGTYYYSKGHAVTYFWNCFDQVLVRPALMARFQDRKLRILKGVGVPGEENLSFITAAGVPKEAYSDHLPLLFEIDN